MNEWDGGWVHAQVHESTLHSFSNEFYYCHGLNCNPSSSYVEALTTNVVVFGDGDFGRSLGLDGIMRVEPTGWGERGMDEYSQNIHTSNYKINKY